MKDKIKITPLLDTLRLEKIDDESYFSAQYSEYISNSRLSLIDPNKEGSPEKFFEGLGKNKIYSTSLDIGSGVHELTLQKDLFELAPDLSKPTAKLGNVADFIYNKLGDNLEPDLELMKLASDTIGWYSGKLTDSRIKELLSKCTPYWKQRKAYENDCNSLKTQIFLDAKSRSTVISCVDALQKNSKIQSILHPKGLIEDPISENEQAILLDVLVETKEPFVLKLKAKLDNYTIDKENNTIIVNDIKTIGKILSEFEGNVDKFSYRRELAVYAYLLTQCAEKYYGMKNPVCKGNFLVVSTIPQYYTKVVPMSKKDFVLGFQEFSKLLRLVADYVMQGYRFQ